MSNPFPRKAEAALDYPDFHYAMLAEILSEGAAHWPEGGARSLPPADTVGIAEKLDLTFEQTADLTPKEEVLLLHVME